MLYWKWKLFGVLDCPAMEYYFEKMAAKGWMLKKYYGGFCGFEKCEPKKIRFQVAILENVSLLEKNDNEKSQDFREYCEMAGWHFICAEKFMQFLWTEYPDAVPVETDEELKLEAARKQQNKQMALMFPWFQALVLFFGFTAWGFRVFYVICLQALRCNIIGFTIYVWLASGFVIGIINLIVYKLWIKYSEKQTGQLKKVWYFNWKSYKVRAFFEWMNIGFCLMLLCVAVMRIFSEYKLWAAITWTGGILAYTGFIIWWQFRIRKKGTNLGVIFMLCVGIWFFNTVRGAVISRMDPELYRREEKEVVTLTEEQAFIHEKNLEIQAEEPIERYRNKNSSYWGTWENYSISEIKEQDEWNPTVFYYEMCDTDYDWLLNMEQEINTTQIASWEKETVSEKWVNGVWVHRYYVAGDKDYEVHMVFRCDKILITMTYMPGKTTMNEDEIMEYVADKVRKKADEL